MSERILLPRLKKVRTEIGLTQEELADMVDMTERTIQRIESGNPTSLSTAKSIASALELPSFDTLTEQHEKENEGIGSRCRRGLKTLEHVVSEYRHTLFLSLTGLVMLMLMIPAKGDVLVLSVSLMVLIPIFTVMFLTMEPKRQTKTATTQRPTLSMLTALFCLLLLAQIASPVFAGMSMVQNEDHLRSMDIQRAFVGSPMPASWFSWVESNYHMVWVISGGIALISLLAIHRLIYSARLRGVSFSGFSDAYAISFGLNVCTALLFRTAFFSGLTPNTLIMFVVLHATIIVLSYYLTMRWAFRDHPYDVKDKRAVKAGSIHLVLPTAVSAVTLYLLYGTYVSFAGLNIYAEKKSIYCNANVDERTACWDAHLLRQHGLPITEQNLTLLWAMNGRMKDIREVTHSLSLPHEVILGSQPIPESVNLFFIKAYNRSLEYHAKQGTIDTVVDLYIKKDKWPLTDPDDNKAWASLALYDQTSFIQDFDTSPLSVRNDHQLRFIYDLLTGNWSENTSAGSDYRSLGYLLYRVKEGRVVDHDKTISLDALERIMSIPESALPAL